MGTGSCGAAQVPVPMTAPLSRHEETEAADFRFSILIFGEQINKS